MLFQGDDKREALPVDSEGEDDGGFADLLMAELDEEKADADGGPDEAKPIPEAEEFPKLASKAEEILEPELSDRLEAVQAVSAVHAQPQAGNAEPDAFAGNHSAASQLPDETSRGDGDTLKGSGQLKKQPTAKAGVPQPARNAALPTFRRNDRKAPARSGAANAPKSKAATAQAKANEATAPTDWKSWDVERATRMRKGQKIYQAFLLYLLCENVIYIPRVGAKIPNKIVSMP